MCKKTTLALELELTDLTSTSVLVISTYQPLYTWTVHCLQLVGCVCVFMQHHIPEEWNPHLSSVTHSVQLTVHNEGAAGTQFFNIVLLTVYTLCTACGKFIPVTSTMLQWYI